MEDNPSQNFSYKEPTVSNDQGYTPDGRVETFVYFTCDKTGCKKQNNRKIFIYDRTLIKTYCPIINVEDFCTYCKKKISEPDYIRVDPFQKRRK